MTDDTINGNIKIVEESIAKTPFKDHVSIGLSW